MVTDTFGYESSLFGVLVGALIGFFTLWEFHFF
jgi:hypothetical protein